MYHQAQKDAVRNEWQKFLNLCICQETHLDNVEEYKKVNMERPLLRITSLSKKIGTFSLIIPLFKILFHIFFSTKWKLINSQRH